MYVEDLCARSCINTDENLELYRGGENGASVKYCNGGETRNENRIAAQKKGQWAYDAQGKSVKKGERTIELLDRGGLDSRLRRYENRARCETELNWQMIRMCVFAYVCARSYDNRVAGAGRDRDTIIICLRYCMCKREAANVVCENCTFWRFEYMYMPVVEFMVMCVLMCQWLPNKRALFA